VRPTILLADDCEMLGVALGEVIARTANLLERVKDGGQLFERARVLRPDIIISDISMPIMNGLDVMRRLKEYDVPARFIFLTGYADEQLATEALSEGAAGFLVKPVVTDDMREAIQTVAKGDVYVPRFIRPRRAIARLTRGLEHTSSADDGRWTLLGR
jgi:two-component system, NarL family, response regulator NreC